MSSQFDINTLSTRFVPMDDERDVIQKKLKQQRGRILHIESSMERLLNEQKKLLLFVAIQEEMLSPMRRLTAVPELLGYIFLHCLPPRGTSVNTKDAPLVLLRVCRRWHDLVLDWPQLWTQLTLKEHNYWSPVDYAKVVSTWMQNVRSLPFSVDISPWSWTNLTRGSRPLFQEQALRPIIKNISRCRRFCMITTRGLLQTFIPRGTRLDAESLLDLTISLEAHDDVDQGSGDLLDTGCINAPNLRRLYIIDAPCVLSAIASTFDALRKLSVQGSHERGYVSQSRLVSFLGLCPNLMTLELKISFQEEDMTAQSGLKVELLSLQSLRVSWSNHVDPTRLISALKVPELQRIHLESEDSENIPSPFLGSALNALFIRSSPPLHHLELTNLSAFWLQFEFWISGLHELQTLYTFRGTLGKSCFEALTRP